MINRLRSKFILISAISVFTVILLVFSLLVMFNIWSMNRNMDMLADTVSTGDGRFPNFFDKDEKKPKPSFNASTFDFITPETRFSTRYFTVWLDGDGKALKTNTESIAAVTEETAIEYAEKIFKSSKLKGWISNYRYKVVDTSDGIAVVFVDGTTNRISLLQTVTISAVVLIVCAAVVLTFIIVLSKRVVKPIAESYEKQKQFITDANHELKTPLTLILTNLDIAEAELGKSEWLEDIRAEGYRMTELVNQLVALSRMDEEHSALNSSEVSLGELVADSAAEFELLAKSGEKTLLTSIDREITVFGDEMLLHRLVGIILDNAVKYCDNGGEISVALERGKNVVFTVENTYSAVNEIELERLFDRFYRADKSRKFIGGYGIGLSMAKSIAEKHKGEIYAYKKDSSHIGFKVILKP